MIIIGELINCTRKKVGAAAEKKDAGFIKDVALRQVAAGAHILDVNGGLPGREAECLAWLVGIVQEATELPLSLDSSDPEALRAALPLCQRRPLINSITDEPARLKAVLPLVREYRTQVVALCMGESGTPTGVDDRVETACHLVDRLTGEGLALEAVGRIAGRYPGVHISAGLSNVSYGLPSRKLVNEVFLMLLMARGLDAAIVDPCDRQLMANVAAAEALLGRDEYCVEYLRAYRQGKLEIPTA
jgi:5-methyltetrahydrofolate--homocysteine methyltransferase